MGLCFLGRRGTVVNLIPGCLKTFPPAGLFLHHTMYSSYFQSYDFEKEQGREKFPALLFLNHFYTMIFLGQVALHLPQLMHFSGSM